MLTVETATNIVARAYNALDVSILEPYLDENTVYESQMVMVPMTGKDEIIKYLSGKFQTMGSKPEYRPQVELAEYIDDPCLVVAQGSKDNLVGTVFVRVKGNKISRIDLCIVPAPQEVNRNGIYPK